MSNPLSPETPFPVIEDVSEVCRHAFQLALSRQADGEEDLIGIIRGREVIGRQTQDRRQILIYRDALSAETKSEDPFEVEFLKPPYADIDETSDDPDRYIERRLFVSPNNPYEFFELYEDGQKRPIGRAASQYYAGRIAYSNLTTIPNI